MECTCQAADSGIGRMDMVLVKLGKIYIFIDVFSNITFFLSSFVFFAQPSLCNACSLFSAQAKLVNID